MGLQMPWGGCRPLRRHNCLQTTPGGSGRRDGRGRMLRSSGGQRQGAAGLLGRESEMVHYIFESGLGQAGGLEARFGGGHGPKRNVLKSSEAHAARKSARRCKNLQHKLSHSWAMG